MPISKLFIQIYRVTLFNIYTRSCNTFTYSQSLSIHAEDVLHVHIIIVCCVAVLFQMAFHTMAI
jgi:hypothetical protein